MTTPRGDPLRPHRHEPNPAPPSPDPTLLVVRPDGGSVRITPNDLRRLPRTMIPNCFIVSTGHGTSGPFTFEGVQLLDLLRASLPSDTLWREVEVWSADGFGNRVARGELEHPSPAGPILLADTLDGEPLSREQGLVRLIVPSEREDALRQVKWVARVVTAGD